MYMKKLTEFAKGFGLSAISFVFPLMAFAQSSIHGTVIDPEHPPQSDVTSVSDVIVIICKVFGYAFFILIALAALFIILAAFRYLTSGGDPEKAKKAGSTLLYAAVAVGVALLARAIPLVAASFLGANLANSGC